MVVRIATRVPIANRLLAALSRVEYQRLLANLEPVTQTFGEVLYEPGDPIKYVYFPNDSLVSLLTVVDRHLALEVAMVGIAFALGIGVTSRSAPWCKEPAPRCG